MNAQQMIEELFTITIPKGAIFYRGGEDPFDNSQDIFWIAFDKETAEEYGSKMCEFEAKRKLKLININSLYFKQNFQEQVNLRYPDVFDPDKITVTAPLGIPSLKTQSALFNSPDYEFFHDEDDLIEMYSSFFGGERASNGSADLIMVKVLRDIYQSFDGYASQQDIPTLYHGLFHKEVCIFRNSPDLFSFYQMNGGKKKKLKILSNTNKSTNGTRKVKK